MMLLGVRKFKVFAMVMEIFPRSVPGRPTPESARSCSFPNGYNGEYVRAFASQASSSSPLTPTQRRHRVGNDDSDHIAYAQYLTGNLTLRCRARILEWYVASEQSVVMTGA